ncbi:MAG: hypothetical protein ACJ79S_04500 [Gemmatimonadaceae bacterium]
MPLWNRLKQELDRAGKVAQDAIDEGKVRLEAFRARQLADKAAQALGYALFRARKSGGDLDAATYERLSRTLEEHEAEATRHETTLEELARTRKSKGKPYTGPTSVTAYEPPAQPSAGGSPSEPPPPPPAGP